jgi:hypothetical protein
MKDPIPAWLTPKGNQIIAIDERLKILRDGWIDARKDKRAEWIRRIDLVLDERLALMKP